MIRIDIGNRQRQVRIHRPQMRRIAAAVLQGEGVSAAEISITVVRDDVIRQLNERYLAHVGPTDVITFSLSEPGESPLVGEIVVSADTAQRVALECGHEPLTELSLYVIHGVLHLCGYDDKKPHQRKKMRIRERHYLDLLGVRVSKVGEP